MSAHIPSPLLWELTKNRSAYTVKRRTGGGAEFSRDPLNLTNKHTRTQEGYINDRAIGLHPTDKGISISTKNHSKHHQPAASSNTSTIGGSSRKSYRTIVNSTGNKGYRPDLRNAAVRRASALKAAQKPVKGDHPAKLRGAKAKKAAESS